MEGPWKAVGPQRAALGELIASLGWLAGIPHTAGGAEQLPKPNVCPLCQLWDEAWGFATQLELIWAKLCPLAAWDWLPGLNFPILQLTPQVEHIHVCSRDGAKCC